MLGSFLWQGWVTSLFFLVFMGPPPRRERFFIDLHSQILQGSGQLCILSSEKQNHANPNVHVIWCLCTISHSPCPLSLSFLGQESGFWVRVGISCRVGFCLPPKPLRGTSLVAQSSYIWPR